MTNADRSDPSGDFPSGVAVVIGGSGGMGSEICRQLAEHGANVALTYRNNSAAGLAAKSAVENLGRQAFCDSLDISDAARTAVFFSQVEARFGRIHTVIVASGADIRAAYVADVDYQEWRDTIDRDMNGFFNVAKVAIPLLRKGGGSFVVTTSAALVRHSPKDILSTAPKAGIEALLRGIAREEGRFGIRANSVALGVIDGGLMHRVWDQVSPEFVEATKKNIPLGRVGLPKDVAAAVVFLASAKGAFITGQRLILDGGYSI